MWAFGTSPNGLALTEAQLWGLTPRQHEALKRQWRNAQKMQLALVAGIRADVRNAAGWTKGNKEPWQPSDFGADAPEATGGRPVPPSKEVLKSRLVAKFGVKGGKSALSGLKGQVLPIRKEA